jgi:glycosyltransferase involved in cell wall biosynthesis
MPRRTRVVHVAQNLEMGGLERLLVEFARRENRAQFDLHFLLLGKPGVLASEVRAAGWPVTALHQDEGFRPLLYLRLLWHFLRVQPDAVHTHDDRPLIYAAPAARLARVRRVIHTRHAGGYVRVTARQAALRQFAARQVDAFVCVSRDAAEMARDEGTPEKILRVVPNGIDLERFRPGVYPATGPAVVVARLIPEKDIATLIKATSLVVPHAPDFRLVIAGDGPCRPELGALVARLELTDRVTFLGVVQDVPPLLASARLFVLPSLSEGISLTLLEAMASGLPVVATRVGGNPEVVADGTTGLLVPSGHPVALAEAIVSIYTNPARGVTLGRAGRARVEQFFDLTRMIRSYEALYRGDTEDEFSRDAERSAEITRSAPRRG